MSTLSGKTLFITGASRGIGLAIALRAARDGANIAIAAKSAVANPKLPGTIDSAADEVRAVGGAAHAMLVRDAGGFSGNFLIDEDVLREAGCADFDRYAVDPGQPLLPDLFLD